jgi:hypothetical protein
VALLLLLHVEALLVPRLLDLNLFLAWQNSGLLFLISLVVTVNGRSREQDRETSEVSSLELLRVLSLLVPGLLHLDLSFC